MGIEDVLRPGWERFTTNETRRGLASREIYGVYELVESGNIEDARKQWMQITAQARGSLGHIFLDDPDPTLTTHTSPSRIEDALVDVMNSLYRSTNNEPLQMMWRRVTHALFAKDDQ